LLALAIGLLIVGLLVLLMLAVAPASLPRVSWPLVILFVILVTPFHELIHTILQPSFGLSDRTTLGLCVTMMGVYTHYEGAISRNRHIAIGLAPFVALSIAPVLLMAACEIDPPLLTNAAIANGLGCSADIIGATLLLLQAPPASEIRNKGWHTYWRMTAQPRP